MSPRFKAPRGTFDILPAEEAVRERIERTARDLFGRTGYGRIETPAFEDTEVFARSVGRSTDIVRKEMFTFEDHGGRSVTLRPEGTAAICRAYLEHGMHTLPQPVRLWHLGPFFRYEAPQAGRFREFNQIGAEAIGSDSPLVDAEQIMLLDDLLRELEVPGTRLRLSSLGSMDARVAYRDELREFLRAHESELAKEVRERIDENPLRAFDSDHEPTRAVMAQAPTMLDRLEGEDATTTRARCSSSRATDLAHSRGSAAAGATTGSSSSSGAHQPPARDGRSESSGSSSRAGSPRPSGPATCSSPRRTASASGRSPWSAICGTRGSAPSSISPGGA
jgi:histidyl-tRNA synthetase